MQPRILAQGISLRELANSIGGTVVGDPNVAIAGLCPFDDPVPHRLTFCGESRAPQIVKKVASLAGKIGAVLCREIPEPLRASLSVPVIIVKEPFQAMIRIVPLFFSPTPTHSGISPRAAIAPSARLGKDVRVGDFVSIAEDTVIGDNVTIHPHVTIYPGVRVGAGSVIHAGAVLREYVEIGADVVIQNGAVIGADGFGYIPDPAKGLAPVPQVGIVQIADRVDVGANSCIDRATFGVTRIDAGSKIDNLVQIGHNVRIGSHSIICGQVGIAGSSTIGSGVVLGGGVGVADHLHVASKARVAGGSVVLTDLERSGDYAGDPARPAAEWRREVVATKRLPELLRRFRNAPYNQEKK